MRVYYNDNEYDFYYICIYYKRIQIYNFSKNVVVENISNKIPRIYRYINFYCLYKDRLHLKVLWYFRVNNEKRKTFFSVLHFHPESSYAISKKMWLQKISLAKFLEYTYRYISFYCLYRYNLYLEVLWYFTILYFHFFE